LHACALVMICQLTPSTCRPSTNSRTGICPYDDGLTASYARALGSVATLSAAEYHAMPGVHQPVMMAPHSVPVPISGHPTMPTGFIQGPRM